MITKEDLRIITATVNEATRRALEGAEEKWLTRKQLLEQFGMITEDWVKKYGKLLNPVTAVVTENGVTRVTREAYPMHAINRMIHENRLSFVVEECEFRPSRRNKTITNK